MIVRKLEIQSSHCHGRYHWCLIKLRPLHGVQSWAVSGSWTTISNGMETTFPNSVLPVQQLRLDRSCDDRWNYTVLFLWHTGKLIKGRVSPSLYIPVCLHDYTQSSVFMIIYTQSHVCLHDYIYPKPCLSLWQYVPKAISIFIAV